MKIIIVGAEGTIGKAVAAELGQRHTIIAAGRSAAEKLDMTDPASIDALFARVKNVDALVSVAGSTHFGPLMEMGRAEFDKGWNDKVMGQIALAMAAARNLNAGGSITLIGGELVREPIRFGTGLSTANAALEGFVHSAALEMPNNIRINLVSPTIVTESVEAYGPYMRGRKPVPASDVALAFSNSVEGAQTGQVYRVV